MSRRKWKRKRFFSYSDRVKMALVLKVFLSSFLAVESISQPTHRDFVIFSFLERSTWTIFARLIAGNFYAFSCFREYNRKIRTWINGIVSRIEHYRKHRAFEIKKIRICVGNCFTWQIVENGTMFRIFYIYFFILCAILSIFKLTQIHKNPQFSKNNHIADFHAESYFWENVIKKLEPE